MSSPYSALAAKVRAKFPGTYDDMSDENLGMAVIAKHPEYRDLLRTIPGDVPGRQTVSPAPGAVDIEAAWQKHEALREKLEGRQQRALRSPTPFADTASIVMPAVGAAEAIPTAAKAGAKFEEVAQAVGKHPVEMTNDLNRSLTRIQQLAERGGAGSNLGPPPVRKFFLRITDPEKPPITYEEARDFYSNLSRLSRDEMNRLTPVMQRAVGQFTRDLGQAIADTAGRGGKLAEYQKAMSTYRRAIVLREMLEKVWSGAKKASPYIAGGAAAGAGATAASKLFAP